MRTPSKSTVQYAPNPVPQEGLQQYLFTELQRISAAIQALADGHLDKSYAAPSKPRDGDIRYADGTTWNPGSGAGVYVYKTSSWVLLG